MNKRQKEVEAARLSAEEKELKHLKAIYNKASEDIQKKIRISDGKINFLLSEFDNLDDKQKSILQSQIYQRQFQESLQKQIDSFTASLNSGQYKSINEYLKGCYETGYIGTMYDIAGQGIPLIMPIDQKKITKAMTHNTKLSTTLYKRLGVDLNLLKKRIANNISRGIATASEYRVIARNIAADSNVGFNRSMRIARTEGHRIQIESAVDAQHAAKDAGADIVKQWDAALDGRTRPHHRMLDGQIRELDEPFEVDGMKVMHPSGFGRASEDVNCRCALLQRARWALDEEELNKLKERAAYYGLDKTKDFDDYRKKYLKSTKSAELTKRRKERMAARKANDEVSELKALNNHATDRLLNAYEERRLKFNLNETSAADLKKSALNPVTADYTGVSLKTAKAFDDTLSELMSEYYSGLTNISVASKKEMFGVSNFASTSHLNIVAQKKLILNPHKVGDYDKLVERIKELQKSGHAVKVAKGMEDRYIATHEFAHSLLDMKSSLKNYVGLDTKPLTRCRKEINKLYDDYMAEIRGLEKEIARLKKDPVLLDFNASVEEQMAAFKRLGDTQKKLEQLRISKYSLENADEFLAEAFTQVKIGASANKYSDEAMKIIDKYFKKSKAKTTKRVKMQLNVNNYSSAFTATKAEAKNTQMLVDYVNGLQDANQTTLKLYSSIGKIENFSANGIKFSISHGKNHAVSYTYNSITGQLSEVKLTIPKLSGKNLTGQAQTTLHEQMHLIDMLLKNDPTKAGAYFGESFKPLEAAIKSTSKDIGKDIRKLFDDFHVECKNINDKARKVFDDHDNIKAKYLPNGVWGAGADYKGYKKEYNKIKKKYEDTVDYERRNALGGGINQLEDIYDALSGGSYRDSGVVKYGHGGKYYRSTGARNNEIVANYGSLSVTRPDLIDMLKKDKPDLVKALDEMLEEMAKKV